jgi:predicted RNA-binding Zn-ribbon protein involved in translation (DUF1610 family)
MGNKFKKKCPSCGWIGVVYSNKAYCPQCGQKGLARETELRTDGKKWAEYLGLRPPTDSEDTHEYGDIQPEPKVCKHCDEEFIPEDKNQVFCSTPCWSLFQIVQVPKYDAHGGHGNVKNPVPLEAEPDPVEDDDLDFLDDIEELEGEPYHDCD